MNQNDVIKDNEDRIVSIPVSKMKKKVFLSGPILGMEKQQEYRKTITEICEKVGIKVINPWLREKKLYKGDEKCWWKETSASEFVKRDLNDAKRCDIMVVFMPILSAGACMELFYAKSKGKKVIVLSNIERLSPWIIYHSDAIVRNKEELENKLREMI